MISGRASGVWRAALWNRTMEPGWTFEVTRRVISLAERSFQSRLSSSVTTESSCLTSVLFLCPFDAVFSRFECRRLCGLCRGASVLRHLPAFSKNFQQMPC